MADCCTQFNLQGCGQEGTFREGYIDEETIKSFESKINLMKQKGMSDSCDNLKLYKLKRTPQKNGQYLFSDIFPAIEEDCLYYSSLCQGVCKPDLGMEFLMCWVALIIAIKALIIHGKMPESYQNYFWVDFPVAHRNLQYLTLWQRPLLLV